MHTKQSIRIKMDICLIPLDLNTEKIMWLETETDHSPWSLYLRKCSYFTNGVVFLQTAVALCRPQSHGLDISPAPGSLLFNQTV